MCGAILSYGMLVFHYFTILAALTSEGLRKGINCEDKFLIVIVILVAVEGLTAAGFLMLVERRSAEREVAGLIRGGTNT